MLSAVVLAVALAGVVPAVCYTDPDQITKLQVLKSQLAARGPVWTNNLASWTCPTPPATTTPNQTCDPCGKAQWWGNWEYVGCRGLTIKRAPYATPADC
ncbi:hypothetical protein WJX73_001276 [Symbiochloris irregularis]|uniref:Uncharacterized protein n=1 Tax=Symbiochloris irregularis TaxID=706552 RepID=A0AAW1PRU6_9CHLO